MVYWIFVVLLTFFAQCMLAPIVRYLLNPKGSVKTALGPRDAEPVMPALGGRFDRALRNLMEALPIFLTLALLAEQKGIADGITEQGAAIFAIARIVYVPAYVSGIPGLRSAVWMVGSAGLIAMVVGICPHI